MEVEHLTLFLDHPTTMHWESLDVVTMVFYFIPIKQDLFQTKLNVLPQLSGKIPMLFNAGPVSVVEYFKSKTSVRYS